MRWFLILLMVIVQAVSAAAQDDKGLITEYLQDALSDLGREVQITGFRGALSSRATMETLTIADDEGVWLTLTDAELDWNRAALLQGRVEINQISAARIDLLRLPKSEGEISPEAGTFSLPDLPVSLRIDTISVNQVVLGEQVIGMPVSVFVAGSVSLADGQGTAKLEITRLDGPEGLFHIDTEYSNATRVLAIDLSLSEAADGITANLLSLPGKPALALSVKGNDPIDDFSANVVLESDGQPRLAGRISTVAAPNAEGVENPTHVIEADIAGDLTPLFAPQYQSFFGPDVALKSRISLFADGRASLDNLTLTTSALRITGEIALSAERLPEHFRLDVILQDSGGSPVLLPLAGAETHLMRASLRARFDRRLGDAWSLSGDLQGLQNADVTLESVELAASGMIQSEETPQITTRVDMTARGIGLANPALASALGSALTLGADLRWREGQPLVVPSLELNSQGLVLSGTGSIDGLESAVTVEGTAQAQVVDLSRFSEMAGRPLKGRLSTNLNGTFALLTGGFDILLTAAATDLSVGVAKIDAGLAGESNLTVSALRNADGLVVRTASITNSNISAEASGQLSTGHSQVAFKAALEDIGQFVDGLNGPADFTGQLTEDEMGWTMALDAAGPNQFDLTAQVNLPKAAPANARIDAKIDSVGWIVPDLEGPSRIGATLRAVGDKWALDAQAEGPGGSRLSVVGQLAQDAGSARLNMLGALPLGLMNRRLSPIAAQGLAQFDMRLDGPFALSSISGQVRVNGARLSLPSLRNALTDIDATVILTGDSAAIRVASAVASGGRVSAQGRIGLNLPFSTDVALELVDVKITDPQLYETTMNGALALSGAISDNLSIAGQIVLGRSEILVPSTGIGSFGEMLEIVHINEPADVRQSRQYAGILGASTGEGSSGGRGIGLDVKIIAENRIFVRGRGLDAELGGQLQLTGTTADIIPQGRFELIRGRLDILGKRLTLEEGSATLQGNLIPRLRLVARTVSDDITLFVIVEGPADAPEINFVSEPELPDDAVLARLLFGRDINTISAFQAVQLASAVATLAGRGGIGIVERLRKNFGFDDLDLATGSDGGTSLRLGKYISENIYTDVEIDSDGQSRINLNLDLTPTTILRGQAGTDGSTGIGIYFEKDY